jgi:membrane protease YdiL (CAAX protease family)
MLILFSYTFLYLTIISLWIPKKKGVQIWHAFFLAAILLGLLSQQIRPIGIIPLILLPLVIFKFQKTAHADIKFLLAILIIVLCVGLAAHLFPGFSSLKVINQVYLSKDAVPFTLSLNFDKTCIGIFILGLSHQLITNKSDWSNLFKRTLPLMIGIILVLITLAVFLGFVRFYPKLPGSLPIWAITNLLFISTAEEAFFRGFLQKNLSEVMKKIPYGNITALFLASLLFGLAHYPGGIKYILLAGISGVGYGFVYDKTGYIEASIMTHFGLNLTHFLLFTYPMLASAL